LQKQLKLNPFYFYNSAALYADLVKNHERIKKNFNRQGGGVYKDEDTIVDVEILKHPRNTGYRTCYTARLL